MARPSRSNCPISSGKHCCPSLHSVSTLAVITIVLSLLVLPMYVPTLIFGAEVVKRGAMGLATGTPMALLAGITAGSVALLPFAAAAAIRVNLR